MPPPSPGPNPTPLPDPRAPPLPFPIPPPKPGPFEPLTSFARGSPQLGRLFWGNTVSGGATIVGAIANFGGSLTIIGGVNCFRAGLGAWPFVTGGISRAPPPPPPAACFGAGGL